MRTVNLYRASDSTLVESVSGETMGVALRRAQVLGERIRPQLSTNIYARDCLGGLRLEIVMRDGKAHTKKT